MIFFRTSMHSIHSSFCVLSTDLSRSINLSVHQYSNPFIYSFIPSYIFAVQFRLCIVTGISDRKEASCLFLTWPDFETRHCRDTPHLDLRCRNSYDIKSFNAFNTSSDTVHILYEFNFLYEISKGTFKISYKILNPYTAKCASYRFFCDLGYF